jgi:hypothetical protein
MGNQLGRKKDDTEKLKDVAANVSYGAVKS